MNAVSLCGEDPILLVSHIDVESQALCYTV